MLGKIKVKKTTGFQSSRNCMPVSKLSLSPKLKQEKTKKMTIKFKRNKPDQFSKIHNTIVTKATFSLCTLRSSTMRSFSSHVHTQFNMSLCMHGQKYSSAILERVIVMPWWPPVGALWNSTNFCLLSSDVNNTLRSFPFFV